MVYWKIMPELIDVGWVDRGDVPVEFAQSLAEQLRDMEYFGCAGRVFRSYPGRLYYDFLEGSDAPWLWFMSTDLIYEKGHPMHLWNEAFESGHDFVTACGGSSILIHRDAVKEIV